MVTFSWPATQQLVARGIKMCQAFLNVRFIQDFLYHLPDYFFGGTGIYNTINLNMTCGVWELGYTTQSTYLSHMKSDKWRGKGQIRWIDTVCRAFLVCQAASTERLDSALCGGQQANVYVLWEHTPTKALGLWGFVLAFSSSAAEGW